MQRWEYCVVHVALYREGSDNEERELLSISLPGAARTSVSHAHGSVGLLNQLGSDGWELVQVSSARLHLKRALDSA